MADPGIPDSMFVAQPIPGGYTWTLASRLGQMVRIAQDLYGSRDQSYTLIGVEFSEDGPQLWYPENIRNVVIQLSIACLTEPYRAMYQLAHECVHLLSPSGGRNATVLEEGLATHFQEMYVREVSGQAGWHSVMPSYKAARDTVERLLGLDREAVKRLRERQPFMPRIGADLILAMYPDIEEEEAFQLASRFERGG